MLPILHRSRRFLHAACSSMALLASLCAPALADTSSVALMPRPHSVTLSGQDVAVTGGVRIEWAGRPTPMLRRAAERFSARFAMLAGAPSAGGTPLVLRISSRADPAYLSVHEREHYTLNVTAQNGISLDADGPAGVVHGLATLLQLVVQTPQGPVIHEATIDDAPRFAWRGVMIDVSRHFMSVETMKRQLDAMELTKLNVLHWHLSDGTGFRVESLRFPRLHQVGGHNQYYTQAQVRDIVAYAADRGIRIVPEFDVPGHTLSILEAYPELAAQHVPTAEERESPCSITINTVKTKAICNKVYNLNNAAFDPTKPQTLKFATELYAEMGRLFPDHYFHSGGDEVAPRQWNENPAIVAYMKKHGYADAPALQAAFTAQVERALARQGKIMMGWDEVSEAPIPRDVVVEAWRGSKWIASATQAGHPVVVSSGYYLDLLNPSSEHYKVDPYDPKAVGLSPEEVARARPRQGPMIDAFALDPNVQPLTAAQQKLVLGGEAPLWSEIVSDEMVDARLWPRSAAIAERFWSDASVRDVADMEKRLPVIQHELEATGLQASAHENAMIARLTPGNVGPLQVLTSVTSPVRNYAMNRLASHSGDAMLNAPGAIAAPDSFEANRFNDMAARYVAGEKDLAVPLRQMLKLYLANDAGYAAVATTPLLQDARPVSQQLAAVARVGLEAIRKHRSHGHHWHKRVNRLLAQQDATFAGCADAVASYTHDQPPSGLLIDILPGLHALVNHAH
ncbi:beta-N-acetylhexosaminidase [Gluconacetobacter entanii]|uniref:beta-N-acetylhexosaminidase n=2 Tax=Gluconacetobacter entanii TaxID=108528 RepID=UPI0022355348|nr:beta-N-acetylhexosaminidase [Gluconacetobacter entanii]MCW4580196.1 beta-N-acetylhexosaminidase [Gluconacetobacter entanii]MCW4583526.1 beta-N-acetylhexosaminidase [Gluconacetobacter entanii]MCW4586872.1 beta-N-acetylhexosaminidase [Gluconacetobacter entanii]